MKTILIIFLSSLNFLLLNGQNKNVAPIENLFEVVWTDTIRIKGGPAEPLLNGNLIIPPYGNDCYFNALTGEKLYYTFSPHQRKIRESRQFKYVLYQNESSNLIVNIENGEVVYNNSYNDEYRMPYLRIVTNVNNRYVFFSSGKKKLTCVDTTSMKSLWTFESDYELLEEGILNNNIYYIGSSRYIYAIDILTGKEKWKLEIGSFIGNLLLDGNKIFGFIESKGVVAINIVTREKTFETERISLLVNGRKLAMINGNIIFVDDELYAVNKTNGSWIYETTGAESCTNTASFFIMDSLIFLQSCSESNDYYGLKGYNLTNGIFAYGLSLSVHKKKEEEFIMNSIFYSKPLDNMIYAISFPEIKDGFWVANIYGIKFKNKEKKEF